MTTRTLRPGELEAELQARLAAARTPQARSRRSAAPRKRGLRSLATTIVAVVALTALSVMSVTGVHLIDLFELEGDQANGGAAGEDWANVFNNTDTAVASVFVTDPIISTDNIFTGAEPGGNSKDIDDVPGWRHTTGSVPDKDDLEHAFAAAYFGPDGDDPGTDDDVIVYFGADRYANNGSAEIGFWFFQTTVAELPGDPGQFSGQHVEGDVLILSDFTQGGDVSDIKVFQWTASCVDPDPGDGFNQCADDNLLQVFPIGTGTDPDCTDPAHPADDEVCATVNDNEFTSVWPFTSKFDDPNQMPAGSFYEGGVNLSALGLDIGCGGSFLAETRSSHSVDSTLKDYALGSFELCPNLQLQKTPDSGGFFVGDSFNWVLNVSNSSSAPAFDAVVSDTIPAGLTINSATFDVDPNTAGGTGNCGVVGQVVTCNLGTIAGSDGNTTGAEPDTARVIVDVTATAGVFAGSEACVTVNNTGSVSADGTDTNPSNNSDGGSVEICRLSIAKDAETSLTRTWNWTITKVVDPDAWVLFDGETGTSEYTISVDKTGFTDSAWAVSGTITITNPADIAATINSVADVITALGLTDVNATVSDCDGDSTAPYSVPANDSIDCDYSATLGSGATRTNTATATQQNYDYSSGSPVASGTTQYQATASVEFGSATVTSVNATINVSDDDLNFTGEPMAFSDDGSVSFTKDFDCSSLTIADGGSASYSFDNTARINETNQTADATVDVTCYRLDVEKTVVESRTRTWNWTISKVVGPDTWALFDGETGTSEYTISVDKTGFTDSEWAVSGVISITNPHPDREAIIDSLTDVITATGLTDVAGVIADCEGDTTAPFTVPKGETLDCDYSATLNSGADRTNTATANQQLYDFDEDEFATADGFEPYSDSEDVDFSEATTTEVNATINVSDDDLNFTGEPMAFSDDGSVSFTKDFDCSSLTIADGGSASYSFDNTARINETNQTADATVAVTCYRLDVEKTADESFKRRWTWAIQKRADRTSLTMDVGQSLTVNYTVEVNASSADSEWAVSGVITITNPHPDRAATINSVADVITALGLADVNATVSDCDGDTVAPYIVPKGDSIDCDYSATLDSGADRTNTATATQQLTDFDEDLNESDAGTEAYTDSEDVDFGDPTSVIDECISVTDTLGGPLGTACANETLPKTFSYSYLIGPVTEEQCGGFNVDNTATFTTNDTSTTGSDSVSIPVTVNCPQGCTLTQGYWKTHNESFHGGAPADDGWFLIGDFDGDGVSEGEEEDFFDLMSSPTDHMTWFEVFWTSPAGRPYYQLAHQWMAAYLNWKQIQDLGGTIPTDVSTALADGQALLDLWDGSESGKSPDLKGKGAKEIRAEFVELAGILGEFNEGDSEDGPRHCDEDSTSELTLVSGAPVLLAPIGLLAPVTAWMRRRIRR